MVQSKIPNQGFSFARFIYRHWFWITIIIVLAPAVIGSIRIAWQTHNPTYPLFELGLKLGAGDSVLEKDVNTMQNNIDDLVGMAKPSSGIWKSAVYYWLFFWNVIFRIWGDVMLIFFPFAFLYKLFELKDNSKKIKNIVLAFVVFVIYLFVINSVVLVHGVISGNTLINLPAEGDTFQSYYKIFIYMMPFHGIVALIKYLVLLAIT